MANTHRIAIRVESDLHERVQRAAQVGLESESAWVRRAIIAALGERDADDVPATELQSRKRRDKRLSVRLRPDDRRNLADRAELRGMAPATYVAVLVRAHLRDLAPIPAAELRGMYKSVSELSAIGRNLNTIAAAINREQRTTLPGRQEVIAMIKVCTALRDFTVNTIKLNNQSWKVGYAASDA